MLQSPFLEVHSGTVKDTIPPIHRYKLGVRPDSYSKRGYKNKMGTRGLSVRTANSYCGNIPHVKKSMKIENY